MAMIIPATTNTTIAICTDTHVRGMTVRKPSALTQAPRQPTNAA
jgi:hypothetical protein